MKVIVKVKAQEREVVYQFSPSEENWNLVDNPLTHLPVFGADFALDPQSNIVTIHVNSDYTGELNPGIESFFDLYNHIADQWWASH